MNDKQDEKIRELLKNFRDELKEPDLIWTHDVQRAVTFINEHRFDRRLAVKWLKKQCHINSKDFSGRFKYYVKKHPRQYWTSHHIAATKKLLKEDVLADVDIFTIALELGFRKHSTFSTTFKNHVDCSPSDFRNGNIG